MNARIFVGIGTLGIAMCSAAGARSISTDGWTEISSGTGNTVTINSSAPLPAEGTLPPGVISLVFSPGTTTVNTYSILSQNLSGDMYLWSNSSNSTNEQVIVQPTGNGFTMDFNYDATGCAGETANLSVNGTSYSARSPCAAGAIVSELCNAGSFTCVFNDSHFAFDTNANGKLQLEGASPAGWSAVAAPEIDPNSAFSGLTLLMGGIAVIVGRRRRPVSIKA
jgi:hypothetical protein